MSSLFNIFHYTFFWFLFDLNFFFSFSIPHSPVVLFVFEMMANVLVIICQQFSTG